MYKCKYCGKTVLDRHPVNEEYCKYSPTERHEFEKGGDFSNDTRWSESLVGRYWKWILPLVVIVGILYFAGVFKPWASHPNQVKPVGHDSLSKSSDSTFQKNDSSIAKKDTSAQVKVVKGGQQNPREFRGSWTGSLGSSEILLVIEEITPDGRVTGYDSVDANQRALKGIIKNGNNFILHEPGNEDWDGVFDFTIENNQAVGIWKSNNGKLGRKFTLSKSK